MQRNRTIRILFIAALISVIATWVLIPVERAKAQSFETFVLWDHPNGGGSYVGIVDNGDGTYTQTFTSTFQTGFGGACECYTVQVASSADPTLSGMAGAVPYISFTSEGWEVGGGGGRPIRSFGRRVKNWGCNILFALCNAKFISPLCHFYG